MRPSKTLAKIRAGEPVRMCVLGHFIPAKLFKTRIEKFYLFFNPWVSLFRYKKVNGKKKYSWFSKSSPEEWNEDQQTTEWETSPGLHLDTVMYDPIEQQVTTENGPVFLQISEGEVEEIGVPHEIEAGAVFVYDPSGHLTLLCAGSGSTITYTEEVTEMGIEYWSELNLVGVSIVGTCPGEPVEGWMKLVNGQ